MGPLWWTLGWLLLAVNAAMIWLCLSHTSGSHWRFLAATAHAAWCVMVVMTMKRAHHDR